MQSYNLVRNNPFRYEIPSCYSWLSRKARSVRKRFRSFRRRIKRWARRFEDSIKNRLNEGVQVGVQRNFDGSTTYTAGDYSGNNRLTYTYVPPEPVKIDLRQAQQDAVAGTKGSIKSANGAFSGAYHYIIGQSKLEDKHSSPDPNTVSKEVHKNPYYSDNITVTENENGVHINVNLNVAKDGRFKILDSEFKDFIDSVNRNWNNSSGTHDGIKYTMSVNLTVVSRSKADFFVSSLMDGNFNKGKLINIASPRFDGTTGAHEFGHLLGLQHRPDGTGSIMSYDRFRRVRGVDLSRIANAYK